MTKIEGWWSEVARCFQVKDDQKVDIKDGSHVTLTVAQPRSRSQHGLLFRAIDVAFDNWPEDHVFKPQKVDELRYYLEAKAGWGWSHEFKKAGELLEFIKGHWGENMALDYPYVHVARSIQYAKMKREDFQLMCSKIDSVLQAEVGFTLADCKLSAVEDAK